MVSYLGGVVAMVGVGDRAAATGDLDIGGTMFGALLRLAMTCIFFRRAARRVRMLWTTTFLLASNERDTSEVVPRTPTFENGFPIFRLHTIGIFVF